MYINVRRKKNRKHRFFLLARNQSKVYLIMSAGEHSSFGFTFISILFESKCLTSYLQIVTVCIVILKKILNGIKD